MRLKRRDPARRGGRALGVLGAILFVVVSLVLIATRPCRRASICRPREAGSSATEAAR